MPLSRHGNEDGNSTSSSTRSPDNWCSNQSMVPGTPLVRTSFFLQRSPVAVQQQGQYFLRSSPPRVIQAAEIVPAVVSNTASAASTSTIVSATAAAVSSTAAADAASVTAAAGIAALSRVAAGESFGIAAAGRGRGRCSQTRGGVVVGSACVSRGGGTTGVNRGGVKNYTNQEVDYMLKCICCVLPLGHKMWEQVAELHGIHFPMQARMAESMKQKFGALANQQPGTGNPNIPPLMAKAKEIREAINVRAGDTNADISDFFEDPDGGFLDDEEEEEVVLVVIEVPTAAAEVEVAQAVATVVTAVERQQSASSGPGSIAMSLTTSKARMKQNQLVGAIEASNEVNSSAFATFLQ
jgi:hypothetical protein